MDLSTRIRITVIVIVTLLATWLGIWNLSDRVRWNDPTDGFVWSQGPGGLEAVLVLDGSEGNSLVQIGDILVDIDGHPIHSERDYYEMLFSAGAGTIVQYRLLRNGDKAPISIPIVIEKMAIFSTTDWYRAILAFTYLLIGVVLGIRHWRSAGAQHFYAICILSYVLYLFTYTNRLSPLDLTVYWTSAVSLLLLPSVFLHFCLTFPDRHDWVRTRPALIPLLYACFSLLAIMQVLWSLGRLSRLGFPLDLQSSERIDKIHIAFFSACFLTGALVLARRFLVEENGIRKQQLKWVSMGTLAGIVPFFVFYVVPFVWGSPPNVLMEGSSLFLTLIPLSFAYAVIRYKLMDVDIIIKRGLTYAIAGSLTLAGYFLLVIGGNKILSRLIPQGGAIAIGAAALTIAFLFGPLRNKIQGVLDRAFYRGEYDYRDSLMEFSKALTTEISLDRLATQILERIQGTFNVAGIALLMATRDDPYRFQVVQSAGFDSLERGAELNLVPPSKTFALSGDENAPGEPLGGLESLEAVGTRLVQPCATRGRVVGLLVMGTPRRSGFFTTEDCELLQVLSEYAAIALENAGLYHSLEIEAYQLEQLKVFNENIIESINVGMVSLDLNGVIVGCNSAFEKIYGVGRSQVIGTRVEKVFSPDIIRAIQSCTGRTNWVIERGASLYKHYLDTRDGRDIIVNLTLIPLQDRQDMLTGSLMVFDDLTEKVKLENQIMQSEKLSSIGLLAAGIAHEVNTPIAGISSYTQILLKETSKDDPRRDILSKIERQTFRAAEIVNNLLNFARIGESKHSRLDINSLIRESLALLSHQFRSQQIEVKAALQESLPSTYGNSNKLQQVLVNLMLNAKDSMPAGGLLEIKTARNNGNILIDITDSGEGMTEDVLNRIYDPFYTTKGVGEGTGLGLAVSYGIIQEHSGRIFVESTPGVGTHFQLKLPVSRIN